MAAESGVSLGQASNVKKILFNRELVSGERGGFSLKEPAALLREWGETYDYRKNEVQEFYSLKSVPDIENALATYCNNRKIKYALTVKTKGSGLHFCFHCYPPVNTKPPSTVRICPVIYLALSETRNRAAFAISQGSPIRFMGTLALRSWRICSTSPS